MSARVNAPRLEEVADLNPVLGIPLDDETRVSFVPMGAVSAETATTETPELRTYGQVKKGYTAFRNGDLLVAKITPCFENGKIAQAALPHPVGFGSTEFHVIRPHPERAHDRYVLQFLRQDLVRRQGERRMTGSAGQRRVPKAFLAELAIPLPPLPEQRRIADILDRAEALRAKRREALARLEALVGAVFEEMFGANQAWPAARTHALGALATRITDGEHLNPSFSVDGMPIVMAGDVRDDEVDLWSAKRVPAHVGDRFRQKCNPEQGDLLIVSRGATVGRLTTVSTSEPFCLMGSVILVKPKHDLVSSVFLRQLLRRPAMHTQLRKTSGSSAQQAIYLKDVKTLQCPLPALREQREFATRVAAIERLKASHRTSLAQLDALFASLQHRAFRGEL